MHTLDRGMQNGLAVYYLLVALLNFGFAIYWCYGAKKMLAGTIWGIVGTLFLIHSIAYFAHAQWVLPVGLRETIDNLTGPVVYTTLSIVGFIVLLYFRRFFVQPHVAWAILQLSLLAGGWAMTDRNFQLIVAKEDNVPISMLIFSVGFFTWAALYRAVHNDERIARGEPVLEKIEDEKVLVWPDLVYTELIAMIVATFVLIIWAVLLKAPLEQPATSAKAPNPSKAPWYFLGLQEMLVYYDPWMAGVVLPTMIIIGLIAIPYIDFNRQGNGYFSFAERKFAVSIFMFGFVVLWVTLIVLGTFLRGPNWNFFGPFEYWDRAQGAAAEQRQLVATVLAEPVPHAARRLQGSLRQLFRPDYPRTSRHHPCAAVFVRAAAALGADGDARVLFADGFCPLYHVGDADAVHGRAAHQNGAALDHQLEVHRRHPRNLL